MLKARMIFGSAIFLVAGLWLCPSQDVPDSATARVAGTWELFMVYPSQEQSLGNFIFTQEGNKLTVVSERNPAQKGEGTINHNNITFNIEVDTKPAGKRTLTYTGTVKGNTMEGTVISSNQNPPRPANWRAKKK